MNHRTLAAAAVFVAMWVVGSGVRADWPRPIGDIESTPTLYDLNGDGRKEVIATTENGTKVYDLDGHLLMECPTFGDPNASFVNVGVADLDGDGSPEIVVTESYPPRIAVFDATCHMKPGWPVALPAANLNMLGAPTLVDLDGDGTLEVAVETLTGVFVFRHDGTPQPNWPFLWPAGSGLLSGVYGIAAGDVDGDGFPDLVARTMDPYDPKLYVLTADGRVAPGWPRDTGYGHGAPALADLDGDGHLEIVTQDDASFVRVYRFDGSDQPGWPQPYIDFSNGSFATPAIADVDGNGTLEIVVANGAGFLYVFRSDGSPYPGFPLDVGADNLASSPSVIDVDGDGRKEMFLQLNLRTSPTTQVVSGWRLDGTVLPGFPHTLITGTSRVTTSSTDIADAEGQGSYALTVGAVGDGGSLLWYLPIPSSIVTPAAEIDAWPRTQHDASNRSCLCTPRPNCDDGNPCTDDTFDPVSGCVHVDNSSRCSDGNTCNGVETCDPAIGCVSGTPVTCAAPDQCHQAGVCQPATGTCTYSNQPDGTPCDDGNPATTDDVCAGGFCGIGASCGTQPKPKSSGYYKKLCKNGQSHPSHSDALTDADAQCVGQLTTTFAGFSTVADLCAVFDHDSHASHDGNGPNCKECSNAEVELMSLAINICRGYVCTSQEVDSGCSGHDSHHDHTLTTVGASLAATDSILSDPNRSKDTCMDARCLAKEINNGKGVHHISLTVDKEPGAGNKLRLMWDNPVMDDGSGEASSYTIWRRPLGADTAFLQIAVTPNLTYVDATASAGAWEYEITFTIEP
jgi:hypothetical protein